MLGGPNVSKSFENVQKLTFDQDPTNLRTSYAESLEKCTFDLTSSASDLKLSSPILPLIPTDKRQFVSSTPNLCLHTKYNEEDNLYKASVINTSLNPLPQVKRNAGADKIQGILSIGSRNSLGKGVSFCPFVSEISWKSDEHFYEDDDEDDSEDYADDDEDDDYSNNDENDTPESEEYR